MARPVVKRTRWRYGDIFAAVDCAGHIFRAGVYLGQLKHVNPGRCAVFGVNGDLAGHIQAQAKGWIVEVEGTARTRTVFVRRMENAACRVFGS